MTPDQALSPETLLVTGGRPAPGPDVPLNTPIVVASTFHAGGPLGYAREGTAATEAIEEVIGGLEGGTACVFASGVAAAAAILDLVPAGSRVVVPSAMYLGIAGRLRDLVEAGTLVVDAIDMTDLASVERAAAGAAMLWIESPTNPLMQVTDISAAAEIGHRHGAIVVCDNTFSSPLRTRPIGLGADIVLHSATKSMGGHSDLLLGATIAADPEVAERLRRKRVTMGAAPGALECFLALRGMRTMALRIQRSDESTMVLAGRLAEHPAVRRVRFPGLPDDPGHAVASRQMCGFGSVLSIEVGASADDATRVCESTRIWVHSTSLGGVESMLERRRRWAGESADVPENLVRLAVGIESVDDLWSDLSRSLDPIR